MRSSARVKYARPSRAGKGLRYAGAWKQRERASGEAAPAAGWDDLLHKIDLSEGEALAVLRAGSASHLAAWVRHHCTQRFVPEGVLEILGLLHKVRHIEAFNDAAGEHDELQLGVNRAKQIAAPLTGQQTILLGER
jgi:hypothetical protein